MRRSALAQAFIVAYLAVQLALALPGWIHNQFLNRGWFDREFSWNMYSYDFVVGYDYRLLRADGGASEIDPTAALRMPGEFYRLVRPDRLPRFHAWLCENARRDPGVETIRARVWASAASAEAREFVRSGVDVCAAGNHGVLER